jgi:hypothetical protein
MEEHLLLKIFYTFRPKEGTRWGKPIKILSDLLQKMAAEVATEISLIREAEYYGDNVITVYFVVSVNSVQSVLITDINSGIVIDLYVRGMK